MSHFKHPIVLVSAIFALIVAGAGYWYVSKPQASDTAFIPVHARSLTEEVVVSGSVTSAAAVDLAFERSGKIVRVNAKVGDTVSAGTTLVALDSSALAAQLTQAEAALEREKIKMNNLLVLGSGDPSGSGSSASVAITSSIQNLKDKVLASYSDTDSALGTYVDLLFVDPRGEAKFESKASIGNSTYYLQAPAELRLGGQRTDISNMMAAWASANADLSSDENILQSASRARETLTATQRMLQDMTTAISQHSAIDTNAQNLYSSYLAGISKASATVNASLSSITTAEQQYRSASSAASPYEIGLQETAVESARGQVDAIRTQLAQMTVSAPVSGIITKQDAQVGAIASPGIPLVSMISDSAFQIEASVSEAEVAKIHAGEDVSVTLDAYGSDVSFPATVTSVDPSATVNQGVSSYRVVIQFKEKDDRIKTGMTANANIITTTKENVLAIPWNSVIARSGTSFVVVKNPDGTTSERQIQTGIRSGEMVEVVSGLTEGELVASFGINQ